MPARHQRAHEDKTNLYHLILDLQYAQAKAGAPANQQNVSTPCQTNNDTSSNPLEDAMCNWHPNPTSDWIFPESLRYDWLKSCAYGFGVAHAMIQWLQQCTWGVDTVGPLGYHMGISWLEIALAVMLHYGAPLPIKRKVAGVERIVHLSCMADVATHGVNLDEMTQNMYGIYRNVIALIPEQLHPTNLKLGKNRSLQVQGLGVWTTGFNLRPAYSKQRRVFELVMSYISMQNTTKEDGVSNFPSELCKDDFHLDPVDINTNTLWDWRYKQSLSKMKMVHACRKGLR